MRRISSKARKGKASASDESREPAADAESQSNGNTASSDDEAVFEKRSSNQVKKNKRGKKSFAVKPDDPGTKSESSDDDTLFNTKAKKGKKGRKSNDKIIENDDKGKGKDSEEEEEEVEVQKEKEEQGESEQEGESAEFEVEEIIDCRIYRGIKEFRIRWKGYEEQGDTWESEASVNCPELIKAYLAEHPNAFKKSSKTTGKSDSEKKHKKPANSAQPKMKKQKVVEPVSEKDGEKVYEVERVVEVHFKKNGEREFLIRWKGFGSEDDTWEPESNLNCPELIEKFMQKVKKAKEITMRELRANPQTTNRFTLSTRDTGRRLSSRHQSKQRVTYYDAE